MMLFYSESENFHILEVKDRMEMKFFAKHSGIYIWDNKSFNKMISNSSSDQRNIFHV